MNTSTAELYAREADRKARGPQVYGGDAGVASLRCFRRYHKDATFDIPDAEGVLRWVSAKQLRVYGILARIAMSPTGASKMVDIALEAGVATSTVSRTITKVEAWGLYAVDVRRGRNGGIRVWRPIGEAFRLRRVAARQKLRDVAIRARIKLASLIRGGKDMAEEPLPETTTYTDASFSGRVLYERAMLALGDPEGEYEAVRPLIGTAAIENALLLAEDARRRKDNEIREAAFAGDWTRWEFLRKERWG